MRISKDRDNETSTATQEAAIRAWCAAHGHDVVRVVVEAGRSAYKASRRSRPGFNEAMQLIKAGVADCFAVWKIDRAARNTRDLLAFVEDDLEAHGAAFASVTEQFDTTTPAGQMMLTIVGALAEMESAQKADRAMEWHRHRRLTGAVPAGPPALGYTKPGPNQLVPDPTAAPLVRRAAENIADGASLYSQAKALAAAGVSITHVGLRAALQSPTLAGLAAVTNDAPARRGGVRDLADAELVEGDWEPILDRDLWERVRMVLGHPARQRHTFGNALKHALAPVARCHCGSVMRVHTERGQRRLRCDDVKCAAGIGYDEVEAAVTAAVLDLLDDETWNAIRAGSTVEEHADTAEIEERLERMWSMVLDGKIEPEEYAEAKARWMGEQAAAETPPADLPDVEDVRSAWEHFTPQERLLVYRAAIKRLVIKPAVRRGGRGVDLSRVDLDLR